MKYSSHIYAKALAAAIADPNAKSDGTIERNFLALVRKNGDESHLRKIIEEAAKYVREKNGMNKITVESARPLRESQRAASRSLMKGNDVIEERVNPELVAGMRITMNDERQFDGSLKAKLDKLFGTL